ncbi:MAG: DoxX family protein [Gemmatimonadetes bacterium]|nr:MAG: DoxX family protein [Gemmatimonadota bacterium]PYO86097.1 MAG: DoxX family protein [Gemmatimonadota bacterium]PYP62594.1 MAG: DoxX family protein [Gemmatimonadota bacterium]
MRKEWAGYAPVVLRVMLAIGFLYHGLPKFGGAGHQQFQGNLQAMGFPAPALLSWVGAVVEVGGALALLAGAFTTIASLLLLLEMLVAIIKVHGPNGFSFMHITGMTPQGPQFGMPGYEVNLLYMAMLLALALGGAGKWSVDERRASRLGQPLTM